jgi:hypothetical protein
MIIAREVLVRILIAIALLCITGCKSYDKKDDGGGSALFLEMPLEDRWRPLEQITERPSMLAKNTVITTIAHTVYVEDIEKFLLRYQPGTPRWTGLLRHEREHSRRQLDRGTVAWMADYLTNPKFQWQEEQIGWYYELTEPGRHWSEASVARVLASYRNIVGERMVSEEDALEWLGKVRRRQWKPGD